MTELIPDSAAVLRSHSVFPSLQRVAVLDYLRTYRTHPTAETIFHVLKKFLPTISLTTVYNTVKLLKEERLIQEVIIEDGELRFDADMREHAHFKCRECGNVFDLFPAEPGTMSSAFPPLPEGFVAEERHLCIRGICADCAK